MVDKNNYSIDEIKNLYKLFFNSGQVGLLDKFEFSNEKISKAKGCYLFTESGKKILDITSGFGTQNLGYNNQDIVNTRINYISNDGLPFSRLFFNENIALLSEKISNLLPSDLNYSFFCNSGAEANEGALKLAYKYHDGKRNKLLHNKNSFHGKLIATSQITDSPEVYFDFQKTLDTVSLDITNLENLKKIISDNKDDIYAIILEPFSASLAKPIPYNVLLEIQKVCNSQEILVIYDEVYSGFYRTSNLFYFMNEKKLEPDLLTYSKSFGGGIASISGYSSKTKVFEKAYGNQKDALLHSSTYSNYVEECLIASKALDIFSDEKFINDVEKLQEYISSEIAKLNKIQYVKNISGDGHHWGVSFEKVKLLNLESVLKLIPIELTKDPRFIEKLYISSIINKLYTDYKILSYAGFNEEIKLFFSPPLVISKEQIDYVLKAFEDVINQNPIILISNFVKNYLTRLLIKK